MALPPQIQSVLAQSMMQMEPDKQQSFLAGMGVRELSQHMKPPSQPKAGGLGQPMPNAAQLMQGNMGDIDRLLLMQQLSQKPGGPGGAVPGAPPAGLPPALAALAGAGGAPPMPPGGGAPGLPLGGPMPPGGPMGPPPGPLMPPPGPGLPGGVPPSPMLAALGGAPGAGPGGAPPPMNPLAMALMRQLQQAGGPA